ncbi:MAG TPA: DUF6798 domain-containing protein [Candidatus Acidoferrales bacterium]|jgi:hypothetical protein|nr:DUF6798 domain-containing protein [Candidatus Acidoferrales bacterium]
MRPFATAAASVALALLTFFQFPGHTWLQQDTQIYVPILEHLRDPAVLRNDILVQHPHVAFTLYDEIAIASRSLTGLGFAEVLAIQQVITRALGIWGLIMMAEAMGLGLSAALLVAAICSLGAAITGPQVLTTEYEPTPRAFAVPLLVCAVGLVARDRLLGAGIVGALAFLYHPPTVLPFWGLLAILLVLRRKPAGLAPLPVAVAVLLITARAAGQAMGEQSFFAQLTPLQEQLQRMRAGYAWISTWPHAVTVHHVILFVILVAAWVRVRTKCPPALTFFALGLPALGLLSMPASWLLLEQWKWTLVPQIQPMRTLLFTALMMQFLTAVAGVYAVAGRRNREAAVWCALAFLLPLHPVLTAPPEWPRFAVALALALALAALTVLAQWRAPLAAPAVAVAAFFAIPLAGVVNYPRLHTPELAQLSAWARSATPADAVFLFPDAAHGVYPGIFRSEALRAVYVDWKGGGQVNYLKELGEQWWSRWQQTVGGPGGAAGFQAADMPKYETLGIQYVVVQARNRVAGAPVFENASYCAYQLR